MWKKTENMSQDESDKDKHCSAYKLRRLCTVRACDRVIQMNNLCSEHVKEAEERQQLSSHTAYDNIFSSDVFKENSDKTKLSNQNVTTSLTKKRTSSADKPKISASTNNDPSLKIFNFSNNEISSTERTNIASSSNNDTSSTKKMRTMDTITSEIVPTDSINNTASSITFVPADTSLKHVNKQTDSKTCQYHCASTSACYCKNFATYRCPHCSSAFCLQHGLQHQEELKEEVRTLLAKAQGLFNNIQRLNITDGTTSCTMLLNQWAATMHAQIDYARNELLVSLDQFNKEIEEKKDLWKTYLGKQLEQAVGCVLTDELQKYESDGIELENARLEYIRLQKLFHSLNNQQLITMTNDTDNQMILHPPLIVCSDVVINGIDLTGNLDEIIESSEQEKNEIQMSDDVTKKDTPAAEEKTDGINDDSDDIVILADSNTSETSSDTVVKPTEISAVTNHESTNDSTSDTTAVKSESDSAVLPKESPTINILSYVSETPKESTTINNHAVSSVETTIFKTPSNVTTISTPMPAINKAPETTTSSTALSAKEKPVNVATTITVPAVDERHADIPPPSTQIDRVNDLQNTIVSTTEIATTTDHTDIVVKPADPSVIIDKQKNANSTFQTQTFNNNSNAVSSTMEINTRNTISDVDDLIFEDFLNETVQNIPSKSMHSSSEMDDIFDVNLATMLFHEEIIDGFNGSQNTTNSNNLLTTTSLPLSSTIDFNSKEIFTNTQNDRILDLSNQNLTDTDVTTVVRQAFENNASDGPYSILDISNNKIGNNGANYLSNLLQNNNTLTTLNLHGNQIDNQGVQYLSNALGKNTKLTELHISQNQIGFVGMQYLSNALKINRTLTKLNLENNHIGAKGVQYLSEALVINNTLNALKLNFCQIDETGAQVLCDALKNNTSVNSLEISSNRIGEAGALRVHDLLRTNKTITTLNLRCNQIGETGAFYLSDALRTNQTLIDLNIERNQIRDSGAKHITDVLRSNTTLVTLNLSNNLIGHMGAKYISDMLQINKTLTSLDCSYNGIKSIGARFLSEAIRRNQTLTVLNLQHSRIGEQGLQLLKDAIRENKTLVTFDIEGNNLLPTDALSIAEQVKTNTNNQVRT